MRIFASGTRGRQHHRGRVNLPARYRGAHRGQVLVEAAPHVPGNPFAAPARLRLELAHDVERQIGSERGDAVDQLAVDVGLRGRKDYFDQISILQHGGVLSRWNSRHISSACRANTVETGFTCGDIAPSRRPKKNPPSMRGRR